MSTSEFNPTTGDIMCPFPLKALPALIHEAVLDVEECIQPPIPLITSSIIGALSLSCQSLIEVKINDTMTSPVSLFSLVIANSGERKTTVDRMVLKPFYQHDANLMNQFEEKKKNYDLEYKVWSEKEKAILSRVRKNETKELCTEKLLQRLRSLQDEKPEPPKNNRYIYNNVTPEALQLAMYQDSPHIGLIADEGANILDRKVMNDLSFINSMWDGINFSIDRKTAPSFTIENGRVTLSVMVQRKPFEQYLKRQGEKARGSGFFARCLIVCIDESLSTQGGRFIRSEPGGQRYLERFHQRINSLIEESTSHRETGERICLSFEPAAQYAWEEIYNEIESRIGPDEDYANMNDFASKLANNVARLAALFGYFSDGNFPIKKEHVESAWLLCEWYMQQAINLFANEDGYYEVLLLSWFKREYSRSGRDYIRYNEIRRCGPNVLRKGNLLNRVIDNLEKEDAVEIDYTRYGARLVCKYHRFNNNSFTKKSGFSFY